MKPDIYRTLNHKHMTIAYVFVQCLKYTVQLFLKMDRVKSDFALIFKVKIIFLSVRVTKRVILKSVTDSVLSW